MPKYLLQGTIFRHKSLPSIFYRPYFNLLFGGEGTKNFIKIQADIQADIIIRPLFQETLRRDARFCLAPAKCARLDVPMGMTALGGPEDLEEGCV